MIEASLCGMIRRRILLPVAPMLADKPFKKTHGEQIKLVKDFSWIDEDAVVGIEQEAHEIFLRILLI